MSEWKPGDVAVVNDVTNGSAPWRLAICTASATPGCEARWATAMGEVWSSVSEARRVVVIDPEDAEQVERLYDYLAAGSAGTYWSTPRHFANALRDFATAPTPKPDEPQGLGAVVEDAEGHRWIRTNDVDDRPWRRWPGMTAAFLRIPAVRVLSEGVTP